MRGKLQAVESARSFFLYRRPAVQAVQSDARTHHHHHHLRGPTAVEAIVDAMCSHAHTDAYGEAPPFVMQQVEASSSR